MGRSCWWAHSRFSKDLSSVRKGKCQEETLQLTDLNEGNEGLLASVLRYEEGWEEGKRVEYDAAGE